MKLKSFLFLALIAILLTSCELPNTTHQAGLTVSPSAQKISTAGTASFTFSFSFSYEDEKQDVSQYVATINFEATNGTVAPTSATTDEEGKVTVVFTTPDPQSFSGGTVKATIIKVQGKNNKSNLFQQGNLATATATVLPLDGEEPEIPEIVDEGLRKANTLEENEFVIDGKKQVIGEWPDDYIFFGVKKDNNVTKVIYIDFCKEHPENASVSGGSIHITPDMLGKEVDMLNDSTGMAWMNLWTLKDINQGYNSESNPEINFNTSNNETKANLLKATVKFTQDPQTGACSALAYFKTKDGKEAYCKVKATVSGPEY